MRRRGWWLVVGGWCALCACRTVPAPPAQPDDPAYAKALDRWTRSEAIYHQTFEPIAFVAATYLSWPYRQARVAEITRERELPSAERDKLLDAERADRAQWHEVFLALHTNESPWNDIDSLHSQWRLALSAGGGPDAPPAQIERIGRADAQTRALFPYAQQFYVAYVLRFPVALPDGSPLIPPNASQAVLLIAGPLGRAELIWPLATSGPDADTVPP